MPADDEVPYGINLPEGWSYRDQSKSNEDDKIEYFQSEGEEAVR